MAGYLDAYSDLFRNAASPLRETCSPHPAVDWGIAASARYIDWVMRSLSRFPPKTAGDLRLDDRKFGIPRRATASRLAPKCIDKPRRSLDEISVLSKSRYVRSLSRDKAVIWRMSN